LLYKVTVNRIIRELRTLNPGPLPAQIPNNFAIPRRRREVLDGFDPCGINYAHGGGWAGLARHQDRPNRQPRVGCGNMWLELARDARNSANELMERDRFRSCVSRAYYAAYSKVAHELVVTAGLTMPPDREGPNHPGRLGTGGIRRLIETSMPNMNDARRVKLSELIGRLYTLRIDADYKPSVIVEGRDAREAISIMKTIFDSF
jgi:uncharacterized protein (UPF0332 family)